jgi:hypothetical protein
MKRTTLTTSCISLLYICFITSCTKSHLSQGTQSKVANASPKSNNLALSDTTICGNGQGFYIDANNKLNNNIWAASSSGAGSQCMWYQSSSGKWGVNATHSSGTAQNIKGYPAIARGWLWYNSSGSIWVNSSDTSYPCQLSQIKTLRSSWNVTVPTNGEKYDTAYDIWLDPSNTPSYRAQYEIMIWINFQGPAYNNSSGDFSPVGTKIFSNISISGHVWDIYEGSNGSNNVMTFRRTTNTSSVTNLDIRSILYYAKNATYANNANFFNGQSVNLLGIQAGWEIIAGGSFTTNSYSTTLEKY